MYVGYFIIKNYLRFRTRLGSNQSDLVLIRFFFAVFVLAPVVATIASHRVISNILKKDLLIFGKSFSMLTLTVAHVALEFPFGEFFLGDMSMAIWSSAGT